MEIGNDSISTSPSPSPPLVEAANIISHVKPERYVKTEIRIRAIFVPAHGWRGGINSTFKRRAFLSECIKTFSHARCDNVCAFVPLFTNCPWRSKLKRHTRRGKSIAAFAAHNKRRSEHALRRVRATGGAGGGVM